MSLTPFPLPTQISLDDEELAQHPATTEDIRACCQDIKVLGRKELRHVVGVGVGARSPKGRERPLKAVTLVLQEQDAACWATGLGWGPQPYDLCHSNVKCGVQA